MKAGSQQSAVPAWFEALISYLSLPAHHKSWEIPARQGRKQACQWSLPRVLSASKG